MQSKIVLLIIIVLLASTPVYAIEITDGLSLNGAFSQGFIWTKNNNWMTETTDGSIEFNELTLTSAWELNSSLRFVGQLLLINNIDKV